MVGPEEPARILYLSYLGGLGGGETSLLALVRALNPANFEPYVICGQSGLLVEELEGSQIPVSVTHYRLPYWRYRCVPWLSSGFFWRLGRFVETKGISLIHCNDVESAYYAGPVARILRVPVVWTCHGWWYAEKGWKGWFYENLLSHIIVPTEQIRREMVEAHPSLKKKVTVIPFGVDTGQFHPGERSSDFETEFHLPPGTCVIALIGRFQEVKGYEYFLEAALQILGRFPNTRFLLVGDNPFGLATGDQYRRKILDWIEGDDRLRTRVILAGFRQDVPRLLRNTDVLICSSLFETFGMVVLEAMACAVPVVSTNIGGPSETVLDGITGYLVPPRDSSALADWVIRLLESRTLRENMGLSGRRRVEEHFSLSLCVARVEQVYCDLLGLSNESSVHADSVCNP
jgi:glycosyltransferase involved in cell wall biosynthesis